MSGSFFSQNDESFEKYQKLTKCFQFINNYCGCCGNKIEGEFDNWCSKCTPHVDRKTIRAPWNRTYFALNGKDCPFQVKVNE